MEDTHIEPKVSRGSNAREQDNDPGDAALMKSALSEFVAARVELAAIEAKEASGFAAKKAVFACVLGVCALLFWLLFLAGLTGWLASWADTLLGENAPMPGWAAIALALAAIHLLFALVFLILLKKKPSSPLFELTKQEIENDKAWVKNKT